MAKSVFCENVAESLLEKHISFTARIKQITYRWAVPVKVYLTWCTVSEKQYHHIYNVDV